MTKNYHEDNKVFCVYKEWEEYIGALESDEDTGRLFKALFAFASRGEEPDFSGALKLAFSIMRNTIERDGHKWEDTCEARAEAGKKGGRKTREKNAEGFSENLKDSSDNLKAAKEPDKEKEKVKEKEKEKDIVKVVVKESAPLPAEAGSNNNDDNDIIKKFGEFVFLTENERQRLINDFGQDNFVLYCDKYDNYIKRKGVVPFSNSYSTLRSWLKTDGKAPPAERENAHSYDLDLIMEHAMNNIPVYRDG